MQKAALAIVHNERGEVLLVKRTDVPVWVLPGGGIEPNETEEHAVLREVFEETGVTVDVVDHVATYTPINTLTSTTHVFTCHPHTDLGPHQCSETSAAMYFPLQSLPKNIFPLHQTFIQETHLATHTPIIRTLHETSYLALFRLFCSHPIWLCKYFWTRLRRS